MTQNDASQPEETQPQAAEPQAAAPAERNSSFARRYSEEECYLNLLKLWRHYGRAPKFDETNKPPSTVSSSAYLRRCGSWGNAIRYFAAFNGYDTGRNGWVASLGARALRARTIAASDAGGRPVRARPVRAVPLGLRFQVLQRDSFKCAACGASPATEPRCKLHVDHIAPLALGGKTELHNLRTLCAACNIGRGAREEG